MELELGRVGVGFETKVEGWGELELGAGVGEVGGWNKGLGELSFGFGCKIA